MRAISSTLSAVLVAALSATPVRAAELRVEPGTAKPGDPLLITVLGVEGEPEGSVAGRPLQFYEIPGGFQAITGLAVELSPGELPIRIEATISEDEAKSAKGAVQLEASGEVVAPTPGTREIVLEGQVDIVDPKYRIRELTVAKKFVSPPAKVRRWMREDKKAFARAQSQPFMDPLFKEDFAWPRVSELTAPFGDLRTFNGKKESQHFGVDLDGRTGDPIEAANDGKVVLVRECYASGNTVIVHHGAGLYTLYFHLSAFDVKEGDVVKKGQLLGKIGKTGRVTGPHLHWSVKADNFYVDGETLLKLRFGHWLSASR